MKNKIAILLIFLAGTFILSSCLKDEYGEYWKDDLSGKMYATVPKYTLQQMPLKPVVDTIEYSFALNIATDALPTEDITLTFGIDPTAVDIYNANYKKAYLPYPYVEILTPTVVIKAGTRTGEVKARVWGAESLNACDNFIAAISIESATGGVIISKNMKSYLLALPIANPFQGDYNATGYFQHPTASSSRTLDQDKPLNTVDCKTVHGWLADLGPDYTLDIAVETTTVDVGGVTMSKVTLSGDGMQVFEQLDLADDLISGASNVIFNYYNPVTKQFVLRYRYNNGAAWREIMETWTRL